MLCINTILNSEEEVIQSIFSTNYKNRFAGFILLLVVHKLGKDKIDFTPT